ncbi:MAG: DoxX family membrane protein [Candidatus Caenarcaniphilales bacterium]|nr:DoxX family membrane protein [Candidatus Caenarcaniphilales bacterium]
MLNNVSNSQIAFFLGRFLYGINFFAHGLVRLPKLNKFIDWILTEFKDTMIPKVLLEPYAFVLVFLELVVGIALFFGFRTRLFLIISMLILISLIFGACMQEAWPRVGVQMVYAIFNYQLLKDYSVKNEILSITKS